MSKFEIQRVWDAPWQLYATYFVLDRSKHPGDKQIICIANWKQANRIVAALTKLERETDAKTS